MGEEEAIHSEDKDCLRNNFAKTIEQMKTSHSHRLETVLTLSMCTAQLNKDRELVSANQLLKMSFLNVFYPQRQCRVKLYD